MKRRPDMDWLGLEDRLRAILRNYAEGGDPRLTVYRLDCALAAFTGRGNSLPRDEALELVEATEWDHVEKRRKGGP